MLPEPIIRKLTDSVLLNACSVRSSGLYSGKAGMALALFEVAHSLKDDYIEDQAFGRLSEALLSRNDDLGFENGLSGVGYTLVCLLNRGYLEGDFDELFGEPYQKIITGLEEMKNEPALLLDSLKMIWFFIEVRKIKPSDPRIEPLIRSLFDAVEFYLSIQFFDFRDIRYIRDKTDVLNVFETYLSILCYSRFKEISPVLLDRYAQLYGSKRIVHSEAVCFSLKRLGVQSPFHLSDEGWGMSPAYVESLTLRERIEWCLLAERDEKELQFGFPVFSGHENERLLECFLLRTIPDKASYAGYRDGLSRFLIFCVNRRAVFV